MSDPNAFHISMLLGPLGGWLALAYAAGAASGWSFCTFTVLRITNKQIKRLEEDLEKEKLDCAREINDLKARVKEVEDRYTSGMENQLRQVRESSLRVLGDFPGRSER